MTHDAFLGGRVTICQPAEGFRSGDDAVLLAAAVEGPPDGRFCDLGTGAGVAALCLASRLPDCVVTGVEREGSLVALAEGNARRNGFESRVDFVEADLSGAFRAIGLDAHRFDAVVANPPYHLRGRVRPPSQPLARAARVAEPDTLGTWVARAAALVKSGGRVGVIHRASALHDLLAAMSPRLGDIRILPLAYAPDRAAKRIIVLGRRDSRSPLRLLPAFHFRTHDGSPDARAECVLRGGMSLAFAGLAD